MKKVLLPLLIASLVLVLAGCPGWFDWFKSTVMSIPEIIQWIEDNDATSTGNFLVETEGIITYAYSYYAYVVDENNNGIKIETDSSKFDMDDDFSPQDRIRIVGSPYRKDYSDAFEYRIDTDVASGMVELIESNVDLPDPVILSAGATLTSDLFAKLVQFTGVYKGLDGYSHYTFLEQKAI